MRKLARHSFYLALLLGTLLTVTGLSFYPELPVFVVVATVLAIMGGVTLLVWAFVSLVNHGLPRTPPRPHNVPNKSDVAV